MGYAHPAPAPPASLPVPALSMVPEQPCGLPVPRKPAVRGSRPHGAVDGGTAHGEAAPLLRDAARYLLRGPVLVPHEPHGRRAPLGFVHEPGAPAAQPPPVRPPLCRRRAVAAPCGALPAVPPDLAGYGRLVPVELPRYLADPLMALPADHDVLALRDAKVAAAVHGASNDACLRKHHHGSRLGGHLVISCCTRSADSPCKNAGVPPQVQGRTGVCHGSRCHSVLSVTGNYRWRGYGPICNSTSLRWRLHAG